MRRVAATTSYKVDFAPKPAVPEPEPKPETPRSARLLALAHSIERRVRSGELRSYAHAACELGLTRARVGQITNLLLLAPEIQAEILEPTASTRPVTERQLRDIVVEPDWHTQRAMWREAYE